MAQQLWLLRHGEAEPHDARPDADRRLTDRGREQSRMAGRALAALKVHVHLCFTSPKVRARETAVLACEALGVEAIDHAALFAGFDVADALELLGAAGPDQRVLVVGHEPDFSQVVHDLTGARIDLKKGGIAAVRLDGTRGELIGLLRPRELERICASTS
ncbi:MAG TPA: histidine phosphatase family protein [Solirubrobacteraceae bacterium]